MRVFSHQRVMQLIGAEPGDVESGRAEIVLPFRDDLTQQHWFIHAGIIADSACGYSAYTLIGRR